MVLLKDGCLLNVFSSTPPTLLEKLRSSTEEKPSCNLHVTKNRNLRNPLCEIILKLSIIPTDFKPPSMASRPTKQTTSEPQQRPTRPITNTNAECCDYSFRPPRAPDRLRAVLTTSRASAAGRRARWNRRPPGSQEVKHRLGNTLTAARVPSRRSRVGPVYVCMSSVLLKTSSEQTSKAHLKRTGRKHIRRIAGTSITETKNLKAVFHTLHLC